MFAFESQIIPTNHADSNQLALESALGRCGVPPHQDVTLVLLVKLGRMLGVTTFGSLMCRIFGKSGSLAARFTQCPPTT